MVSTKHLQPGDILVREGESSNSMYWVQGGSLRLFKQSGGTVIELGTVKAGEVVGELSFLDNLPRSASVEATEPSDVVVIPRGNFDEVINHQPSWLRSLVQTLVQRLRVTSDRVKELEATKGSGAALEGAARADGPISDLEAMRLCSALLLASSRNGEKTPEGKRKIKSGWVQFYGAQILGVPAVRVAPFVEALLAAGVLKAEKTGEFVDLHVLDPGALDRFIYFAHEESAKPESQRLAFSANGMALLESLWTFGGIAQSGATEVLEVDVEKVFQKAAAAKGGALPFEWSAFDELVKAGLAGALRTSPDGASKIAPIQAAKLAKVFPPLALRAQLRG